MLETIALNMSEAQAYSLALLILITTPPTAWWVITKPLP